MDIRAISPEALALIAVAAVAIALVQALALAARRLAKRRRMSVRMRRAAAGEQRAAALLEEHGYRVIGAQVVVEHAVRLDARVVAIELRADYLAEKRGGRYVVEVKTGALAPRLETSATRRQILEYRVAFDVDGVVLVDAESGTVHEVTFPALERFAQPQGRALRFAGWALAIAMLTAAVVIARST